MVDAVGTGALLAADSGPELPTGSMTFLPPEILFPGDPLRDQSHHIDPHRGDRGASRGARYHGEARQAHPRPLARRGRDGHRLRARQRRISGHGRAARQALRADDFDVVLHDLRVQPVRHHPGMNMAATATVVMPLVFAVWVLIQYWITAAREKGLWGYIRDECFPKGVPWPVYILLAPIQLCELVLIRPASLTIRLFANMISGHLLVASCLAFAQYWVIDATNSLPASPSARCGSSSVWCSPCSRRSSPSCRPTCSPSSRRCTSA